VSYRTRTSRRGPGPWEDLAELDGDDVLHAVCRALAALGSVRRSHGSVVGADQIVVLSHGRLVEQGTHDDLLGLKGAYHQLGERPSGFVISSDGRRAAVTPTRLRTMPAFAGMDEE
jgi:hypothetical protein